MFGHKSFLKLGALADASIQGLYKESYELESCSYGFSKGVNSDGKPQTEVRGGTISVTIPGIPPDDIIQWSLESRNYKNGSVVVCDTNDIPLEKVHFTDAACIGMDIVYSQKGKGYIATKLILQARKIVVGNAELDNYWTGFNQ
jgi:hypothetical protein